MNQFTDMWQEWKALYEARIEPESMRPLAELYWRTMIGLAVLMIVAIVGWGVWEFVAVIDALTQAPPPTRTPALTLNRVALEQTITAFQARQASFDAAKAAPLTVTDPSK